MKKTLPYIVLFCSMPAYAYIDPGMKGLIIQAFTAIFGVVLIFSKRIISALRNFFKNDKKEEIDKKKADE